jgi:adenine-specific DNA-methyltransferase
MVHWLKEHMPKDIDTFYDLFGGGMSVSVNADANKIVYNDINFKVRELLEHLTTSDTKWLLQNITRKTSRFKLAKCNDDAYYALRESYNSKPASRRNLTELFLLIMYGFQQQIRFNSNYDFNNPAGNSSFNEKIKEKLISFVSAAKDRNIVLASRDYEAYLDEIKEGDFVYLDPPYLITLGSYNDGKRGFNGWNEMEEERLLRFADELNNRKIRFMMSNILEHKEKENTILKDWISRNSYHVTKYERKTRGNRKELIITNYTL